LRAERDGGRNVGGEGKLSMWGGWMGGGASGLVWRGGHRSSVRCSHSEQNIQPRILKGRRRTYPEGGYAGTPELKEQAGASRSLSKHLNKSTVLLKAEKRPNPRPGRQGTERG